MTPPPEATLAELGRLFRDFFMDDGIVLSRTTTVQDIAGWDSLTNISLMLSVQRTLGIKFNSREQDALRNVGDLVTLVDSRRSLPTA